MDFADDADAALPLGFFLDPKILSFLGAGVCAADLRPRLIKLIMARKYYFWKDNPFFNLKFKFMKFNEQLAKLQPLMATVAAVGVLYLIFKARK
jgi:hypothetical protein